MSDNFLGDVLFTNSIVGFLYAGYQGSFASYNVLSQLGFLEFNPEDLKRSERNLSKAEKWSKELLKGVPILSTQWTGPQTLEAKSAFEMLVELRKELAQVTSRVRKILAQGELSGRREDVKYLLAAFTRHVYSREHYVRGFISLGKQYRSKPLVEQYEVFIPEIERGVTAAHNLFSIFNGEESPKKEFFQGLSEECSFLPGIFRSQMHEVQILLSSYSGPFTFEKTDIPEQDYQSWVDVQILPEQAGYWHAYHVTPPEAIRWMQVGVGDPQLCWFWISQGFTPFDAGPWVERGFFPPTAKDYRARGFSADEALEDMERTAAKIKEKEEAKGTPEE